MMLNHWDSKMDRARLSKGNISCYAQIIVKNFLVGVIVLSLMIIPAFAQTEQMLILETAKATYEEGETITVSGKVGVIIVDTPVTLQIMHEGNLIEIAQLEVAQDGTFSHTILAQGPQWTSDGEYIIRGSYGQGNVMEISFDFVTSKSEVVTSEIFEVDADSAGTFDVMYTIRGGTVNNMVVDYENFAINMEINSESDGAITLELPRDAIDAKKSDGTDDVYIILIDGIEVPYEQVSANSETRTLKIDFEKGDSNIQVIGTFVIPEFGALTFMVLFAGITVTVLVKVRNATKSCIWS